MDSLAEYRERLDEVGDNPENHAPPTYRSYYMNRFLPQPGDRLLDFGSYLGGNLIHYALLGHKIEGIEGSLAFREEVEERIVEFGLGHLATVNWCLIEEYLPIKEFDGVICGEVLSFVLDPLAVCQKACECLAPGGQFFVTVTQRQYPTHARSCSQEDLKEWVEGAGFEVQQLYHWRCDVPQIICLARKLPD